MGLDPGLVATGFAVLEALPGAVSVVDSGVITTSSTQSLEARLNAIYRAVHRLIETQKPTFLVVEDLCRPVSRVDQQRADAGRGHQAPVGLLGPEFGAPRHQAVQLGS